MVGGTAKPGSLGRGVVGVGRVAVVPGVVLTLRTKLRSLFWICATGVSVSLTILTRILLVSKGITSTLLIPGAGLSARKLPPSGNRNWVVIMSAMKMRPLLAVKLCNGLLS